MKPGIGYIVLSHYFVLCSLESIQQGYYNISILWEGQQMDIYMQSEFCLLCTRRDGHINNVLLMSRASWRQCCLSYNYYIFWKSEWRQSNSQLHCPSCTTVTAGNEVVWILIKVITLSRTNGKAFESFYWNQCLTCPSVFFKEVDTLNNGTSDLVGSFVDWHPCPRISTSVLKAQTYCIPFDYSLKY